MKHELREYPMHRASKCGAKTRSGTRCLSPAMANGRCRMHGGLSLVGTASPRFRHGWYTRAAIARRRELAALIASVRKTILRVECES